MMQKKKFLMTILSVLIVGIILCACNKSSEKVIHDSVTYIPENVAYTADLDNIYDSCVIEDTMYLIGRDSDLSIPPKLLRLPLTGGNAEALPEYQPALKGGNIFFIVSCLRAGTGGTLWVSEMISNVQPWQLTGEADKAEGSGRPQEALVLRQLDRDGKELFRFSAMQSELEERLNLGAIYSQGLLVDGEGTVYVNCEKGIAVLDEAGAAKELCKNKFTFLTFIRFNHIVPVSKFAAWKQLNFSQFLV